jgi:putative ABC transport system permease protein
MSALETLRVALVALARNKVRSLLTALGIIVGIAAVIAVVAVGSGASTLMRQQIGSMGDNIVMVFPGSMSSGGQRMGSGSSQTLTADDGRAVAEQCDMVKAVSPVERTGGQVIYLNRNWATQIQGVDVSFTDVRSWPVRDGTFFTDTDVRTGSRVCVLGATTAKELFGDEEATGKMIRVRNMPFRVLGVMEPKGSSPIGQDQDDVLFAPYTTVRRVLQNSRFNNVDQLILSVEYAEDVPAAMEETRAILRQRHRVGDGAEDDFTVVDMAEITKTITGVSRLMSILLTTVASISLVVGGIGIMNIMLVSVTERTREIGVRMAVGARPGDILLQFLAEAVVLSLVGGVLGMGIGVAGARILGKVNSWPILISTSAVGLAIAFSAAVGVFFGFYPALRASRLNPIECLRYE